MSLKLLENKAPVARVMILLTSGPGQPWTIAQERFHLVQDAEAHAQALLKKPNCNFIQAEVVESVSTFRTARTVVRVGL